MRVKERYEESRGTRAAIHTRQARPRKRNCPFGRTITVYVVRDRSAINSSDLVASSGLYACYCRISVQEMENESIARESDAWMVELAEIEIARDGRLDVCCVVLHFVEL